MFASKARYSEGPAAARIGLRKGVGRVFGVPQRGTAYQPKVKPWVRYTRIRSVLKERRIVTITPRQALPNCIPQCRNAD